MSYAVQGLHKVVAGVAAVAITALLQGAMLAGFDGMASEPQCTVVAKPAEHDARPGVVPRRFTA